MFQGTIAGRSGAGGTLTVDRLPERLAEGIRILERIAAAEAERIRIRSERDAWIDEFGGENDVFLFLRRKFQTATMRRLRGLRAAVAWWREGESC